MPKLAATLASLLLIASSIGVNIARYPQVGRMAEPGNASAAEPAGLPQTASQSQPVETADRDMPTAKAEAGPATEKPRSPAQEPQQRQPFSVVQTERPAPPAQADAAVPIIDVRPMVPVANLTGHTGGSPAPANELRRLPPVETAGTAGTETNSLPGVEAAAYPSTSTP